MATFLAEACAAARARVASSADVIPLEELRGRTSQHPDPPSFAAALSAPGVPTEGGLVSGVGVIAEVKRASPSRGDIALIPCAAALASAYVEGGAAAVSVLTEPRWFKGSSADLAAVAHLLPVPALRKDFVVEPYQVWEARGLGAAAVLVIVAALDDAALANLLGVVKDAGLDALVEVHDVAEAKRAVAALDAVGVEQPVIGVNARDLTTLEVDVDRFPAVRDALPGHAIAVAESGIRGPQDVERLAGLGADAVLVGESVAAAADPTAAVRALTQVGVAQ